MLRSADSIKSRRDEIPPRALDGAAFTGRVVRYESRRVQEKGVADVEERVTEKCQCSGAVDATVAFVVVVVADDDDDDDGGWTSMGGGPGAVVVRLAAPCSPCPSPITQFGSSLRNLADGQGG